MFNKLFTTLIKIFSPRFIPDKSPNRWTVGGVPAEFNNWNNIHEQFNLLIKQLKLPTMGHNARNIVSAVDMHINVLKSDAGLTEAQQAHTDEQPPFSLGTNTKYFNLVTITGIEKETLFYIQALGMDPQLILIERGDTLFFRTDIPHAGAENLTDNMNVRLHVLLTFEEWNLPLNKGFTTNAVRWHAPPSVKWDGTNFKFKDE